MRFPVALRHLLCALLTVVSGLAQQSAAPGAEPGASDLLLVPTRIVLEGRQRAGEVVLKNIGKAPATYRILLREMEMGINGQLKDREKASGEITAADMIRYSPRQVELAPGESQTVRIQLRKPEALPDGEYRSHMLFQGVPPAEIPQPADEDAEKKLTFNITAIYGMAIPIIVRHGETKVEVSLANLTYSDPAKEGYPPIVKLDLQRRGNISVLGDFDVTVESGGKLKKGLNLCNAKGAAIYHTIGVRNMVLPLWLEKGATVKGSRLKVTFTPKDVKLPPVSAFLDVP